MALDVQLLDLAYVPVPLVPSRPGAPTGPLDHDAIRRLRPAAEAVVALQTPQVARLASHPVTLSPVRLGGALVGVMIVAHLDAATAGPEQPLATVSGWLRTAVEQHLSSQAVGADHLAALNEALRASAFDGSDRRLVSVFAEALAVWHDIEVVGYVETAPGVFTTAVSLAGRRRAAAPLVFPPQAVPAPQRLIRMPQTHVDNGDRSGADALVVTLTRSGGALWLLTLSGEIDACDPALLSGYVSALDITLALTTRAASARVALAVASDLAAAPLDSAGALDRALERLRRALGASAVRFSTKNTMDLPTIGARAAGAAALPGTEPPLVIECKTSALGHFALEIERQTGGPWTPVEHAQARAVADVLEGWAERRLPASAPPRDADTLARSIDERVARTLERGDPITLAVFACSPSPTAAQAAALLTESRRFLREGDEAGILPNGQVVFLLPQTTAPQAQAVTRRLKADLARAAAAAGISIVAEAFASRMPGQEAVGSLLHEARSRIDDSGPVRA